MAPKQQRLVRRRGVRIRPRSPPTVDAEECGIGQLGLHKVVKGP